MATKTERDVTVREAIRADLSALEMLFTRFYQEEGFDADAVAAVSQTLPPILERTDTACFVALIEGQPVGAAAVSTSYGLEVGLYAELEDLYVLPTARNRGAAAALVDAVKAWCVAHGCHDLEVVLTPQAQANETLVRWYAKRGFATTKRVILECPLEEGGPADPTSAEAGSIRSSLPTPGLSVAGIDGCKAGWVMIRRRADGQFDDPIIEAALETLPATDFVVIDIPIGLPDSGKRACDLEAKSLLGPRRSSVFTGVRRPLLDFADYESANAWGKTDGAGISKQMWGILPKIRTVDRWITPEKNARFREGHPEVAFAAAAGAPLAHYKKSPDGEAERIGLLERFIDPPALAGWLATARPKTAARDDLIDAAILCWTAARVALGINKQIPTDPPRDARGLPMEMVF